MSDRNIDGETGKVYQAVRTAPMLGEHVLEVPPKPGQAKRKAVLRVRSVQVTLTPDTKRAAHRKPTAWTLLEAWEADPPDGAEPIHWLLWTNQAVETLAQAVELLKGYSFRWRIEEFHLVLKSGCRIEDLRLETAERLANAIALYSPVAVAIVALRDLGRREPDAPCTRVLNDDQWRALWACFHKETPARDQAAPTMRQAVLWIGRLGGHLGRKHDGMPGAGALWRGWRDLTILTLGYRAGRRH